MISLWCLSGLFGSRVGFALHPLLGGQHLPPSSLIRDENGERACLGAWFPVQDWETICNTCHLHCSFPQKHFCFIHINVSSAESSMYQKRKKRHYEFAFLSAAFTTLFTLIFRARWCWKEMLTLVFPCSAQVPALPPSPCPPGLGRAEDSLR